MPNSCRGFDHESAHHLLEVRDVPILVHAVAVKPAADVIVHAACRHLTQRRERHVQRFACAVASKRLEPHSCGQTSLLEVMTAGNQLL